MKLIVLSADTDKILLTMKHYDAWGEIWNTKNAKKSSHVKALTAYVKRLGETRSH